SHIDHGKSTLADRFLEVTGTIPKEKMREQFLDAMDLEREKGITIKMKPVRMQYRGCILNLIDTPGHVDFNYEVSRSLAAVEGAILLVDASKGIQAQTISNLDLARKQNLVIIPAINKIDLPQSKVEETKLDLANLLGINPDEVFLISAKIGTGVSNLLEAAIKKIPPPKDNSDKPFRALIFDSEYDTYKGVVAFIRVIDGMIKLNEKVYLVQAKAEGDVKEIGYRNPKSSPVSELKTGEIGYLATGIKEPGKVRVGDTITLKSLSQAETMSLAGYKEPKPMVFLSIYPEDSDEFDLLKDGLEKLKLNDAALTFNPESKEGLGRGFQCGFLGLLHAEIISERLKREFGLDLILSIPSVVYKIIAPDNKEFFVYSPSEWPDNTRIKESQELWANLQVLTPVAYLGQALELLESIESRQLKTNYLGIEKIELVYEVPLREIISKNFYDKLKSLSKGFASMNYDVTDWRKGNFVKLDILILGRKEEALSKIVSENDALKEGKKIVEKLRDSLPSQLFSVPLQAAIGGKIVARETLKALRRDVIAPLYGGDYSRKRKLLEKQKKGKKKLKDRGKMHIPPQVFLEMFKG
ncbi:MAG: translation elongation factor 4, partial [Candidatus Nealsonbacteria bacterium]|nr:translation elongation factor 4 [Candidatus Nealsonbacteria bacterium]